MIFRRVYLIQEMDDIMKEEFNATVIVIRNRITRETSFP